MSRFSDYLFYCLIFSIPVLFVLGAFYYRGHHSAIQNVAKSSPHVATKTQKQTASHKIKKPTTKNNEKKVTIAETAVASTTSQLQPTPTPTTQPNNSTVPTPSQVTKFLPTIVQPSPIQTLQIAQLNESQVHPDPKIVSGVIKLAASLLPL